MNKAGSKIDAHIVITMETSSVFLRSQKDFQKVITWKHGLVSAFLRSQRDFQKDKGLVKYDVSAGWLWCRRSVQYFLASYEEKNQLTR